MQVAAQQYQRSARSLQTKARDCDAQLCALQHLSVVQAQL